MDDLIHDQSKTESHPKKSQGKPKNPFKGETTHSQMNAEHSFLTDIADVRQMEQGLLQLLEDFHQGQLQAFGENFSHKKMDEVREKQETLARLQFELDSQQDNKLSCKSEAAIKNMAKLMDNLEDLCKSIQNLHQEPAPAAKK